MNWSRFHTKEIFTTCEPVVNPAMSRSQRDVAYRLELTREALGLSPAELCKILGIGTNQWSQYTDPEGKRRITIDVAHRLRDEYGITFDWIYAGDRNRLPGDLLEKIRATERLGPVDLSRVRGRRKRPPDPPDDSHPVK